MGVTVITCKSCGMVLSRPVEQLSEVPNPTRASPEDVGYLPTGEKVLGQSTQNPSPGGTTFPSARLAAW